MQDRKKAERRQQYKKEAAGALEIGDLIPMSEDQKEFLKVHNMFVYNPEMEAIMAADTAKGTKMDFHGQLPWKKHLNLQDYNALHNAQSKPYECRNRDCSTQGKPQVAEYVIVMHEKELETDELTERHFGQRKRVVFHCGVKCKTCGRFIKFVKRTASNRRAAQDPLISGPHQRSEFTPGDRRE